MAFSWDLQSFELQITVLTILIATFLILLSSWLSKKKENQFSSVKATVTTTNSGDSRIGESYNDWRIPVCTFGQQEFYIKRELSHLIRAMEIHEETWKENCETANVLFEKLYDKIIYYTHRDFNGLEIRGPLIKFGSSRDGLKVQDALEYDTVLLFDIKGMQIEPVKAMGKPGFLKIKVLNGYSLMVMYPWIAKKGVMTKEDGSYYLNTKALQRSVFKSVIDQVRDNIEKQFQYRNISYRLNRTEKPPTFDINITLNRENGMKDLRANLTRLESLQTIRFEKKQKREPFLSVDIVPALLLRHDLVPDPFSVKKLGLYVQNMQCPVYAVMKWAHRGNDTEPFSDQFWRECTSGYENHILDVARRNDSQRYLMTSCRLLKTYVANLEDHDQLQKVVASQYLKTICFYCIVLLTVPSDKMKLGSFKDAFGYFLNFLQLSIEAKNLPHFFFGNPYFELLFPNTPFVHRKQKKNLYAGIHCDTFYQAAIEFDRMKDYLSEVYTDFRYLNQNIVHQFQDLLK